VERCGARTLPERILVHDPVDLIRRHPCADLVTDEQQSLGSETADRPHLVDFSRALDVDRHGCCPFC
jgi:hypothetical protein